MWHYVSIKVCQLPKTIIMSKSGGLAHDLLEMPCLGRPFQLGTLYDCRNDSLIPGVTLWGPETLRTALHANMEGSDFEVITSDSLSKKTFLLDVSAGLKLSVLGGLVKAGGSGKFLYDRTTSKNQARVSLRYKATSRFEQLNTSHLGKFEYPQIFDDDIATHVVTGVQYGADAIFVFDRQVESSEKLKQVHGNLEAMISALPGIDLNVGGSADLDIQKKGNEGMEEIHCKFYGDFILPKNPTMYQDAVRVYQELPKLLGGDGYPKSVAKKVWLYPLSKLDSKVHRLVREISSHLVDDVQELLESLHELEIQTNDLLRHAAYNYFFKSKGDLEKLQSVISSYRSAILRRLSTLLPQVRGGGADETKLAELIEENGISPFSYDHLSSWIKGKEIEVSTLAVYLEELKNHQIQFAFSPAELVGITSKFDGEKILCFDFNIPAGNDIYLQRMEAYLHEQTLSQELQVQKAWYKTHEIRQAFQRFVNFVKTNTGREDVKYAVTNETAESVGKLGVVLMYEDACSTMFEPPDQPSKPQALSVTHNSIQLKWDKPSYGATSVQSYTVAYSTSDDPIDQWCTQASDAECLELINLTPGSRYYIKVTAETSVGSSPASEVSEVRLPPDQPGKPVASDATYSSVHLKWTKPKHGAETIQSYAISGQAANGQCHSINTTSKHEYVTVTKLTPKTVYMFKVKAVSAVGPGPDSELSDPIETTLNPPGKPRASAEDITYNSIKLTWDKPSVGANNVQSYTVSHRWVGDPPDQWRSINNAATEPSVRCSSLDSDKLYVFRVRAETVAGLSSRESECSEVIKTLPVPLSVEMLPFCVQIEKKGDLLIYQLPIFDVMRKKDIAKVQVGQEPTVTVTATATQNRVLMVVGATGAGKSTLINGIANYIMGVHWNDDFRFKLITESGSHDQSKSQTNCITAYTFPKMKGSPLPYSLTVIDTPEFGDTGGLERDEKITKQIKEFFRNEEDINQLHAIGFVTQASLTRLNPTQRYIFDAILSVFGKDIGNNIHLMTTSADGQIPPVINAVKFAKVPFENYYKFNNSALFASRTSGGKVDEHFWDLGIGSFKDFFDKFALMKPRSLHLMNEVLKERERLEASIQRLQPRITAGLAERDRLLMTETALKQHKAKICDNKDFKITVIVNRQRMEKLPHGQFTTTCMSCHYTCHEICGIADDDEKHSCSAMGSGSKDSICCRVCPQKCTWKIHKNTPYKYVLYQEQVTQTLEEIKARHESAVTGKLEVEGMIDKIKDRMAEIDVEVDMMINQVRQSLERLQEIALKPNPLTQVEYIDLLIESEKQQAQPGWK